MKVLQVNKYYDPVVGGVETVCKQYAEYLKGDNEVTILCVKKDFSLTTNKEVKGGIKVYRCSSLGTYFSMPVSFSFIFYYFYLKFINDVVVSHLPFPLFDFAHLLSKLCLINKPLVLVWHSDIVKQKLMRRLLYPVIKHSLNDAKLIVTTSPNMIEYSYLLYRYEHKCIIIPLGIDVVGFDEKYKTERNNTEGYIYDGFFFGRLTYYKGAAFLIDSLVRAKELGYQFNILIAGSGDDEDYISAMIDKHSLSNVTFINRFISESEKIKYFSQSKCFLFPSITNSEAFGITQLEAMLCETPVINTNLKSGVPWVSQNNYTGITIEPLDKDLFIKALLELKYNDDLREEFIINCREHVVSNFDERKIGAMLINCLNNVRSI